MSTTEYINERAKQFEAQADQKIAIIDELIVALVRAEGACDKLPRGASLLALFLGIHSDLVAEKAALHRIIEDSNAIRAHTREVGAA
jgi:hypothetical protein